MENNEIKETIIWFIRLRWIAIIGVSLILLICKFFFNFIMPYKNLFYGLLILLILNLSYVFYLKILKKEDEKLLNKFSNMQIFFDILMIIYLLHFSGSIENPFSFYFIFHMVIASILLSNFNAYFYGFFSLFLFSIIVFLEYLGKISHHHIEGFLKNEHIFDLKYTFGNYFVLGTTVFITIYLATKIVNKLRERDRNLEIANEILKEQDRIKSKYVLTVSHDLQSPLATILNCLRIVIDGYTGDISEKAREMIKRAEEKTLYLINFVKDLLDLSKIKVLKEIEKNYFSIKDLIFNVINDKAPKAREKNIEFLIDVKEEKNLFYGNKEMIEELFSNLIDNSIKYNTLGGKIVIEMKEINDKTGCFHFRISDTGIGIPPEDKEKIFNEFYRSKNAILMVKDGTGLGLSIVKEIIKNHKGDIWVESEVGKGTSFFLPYHQSMNVQTVF